ncbi:MAG TPA: tetratricopeptide repeat protein [Kofleriaceae bacterium]|nr:tetratricopeptide repeat protein [Kofleriaceae bacterium]
MRDWLHRDVETLDDAARLLLDDHLATCARCRDDREQLRRVRQLGELLAVPPPGAREYNRAIARALLEGSPKPAEPAERVRPRAWIPMAAFAAVAAAAAIIAYVALRDRGATASEQRATAPTPAPDRAPGPDLDVRNPDIATDLVDEGVVLAGATTLAVGDAVPADALLRVETRARVRLGAARVVIIPNAELRWLPGERTVRLERGTIEVDSPSGGVARVVAARFVVELTGPDADVTVEPTVVRVRRGSVTLFAPSSQTVLARVEAGGEWTLPDPARTPASGSARTPTVAELMTKARRQFAARQYAEAARTTEDALDRSPRRSDEAEARIFLGDIAQATGDLALAARRYTAVADTFAGEPAAESALYAVARIELRRGRTAAARALLARYLDRHPAGRYADDVRRELDALTSTPP